MSFGTTELQTEQFAIVGDLRGDGPSWVYGSTVLGDERVRATSRSEKPLFVGIARTLTWTPRDGDWSVVLMNADASGNVDVRGDASAELPLLPWLAGGLLVLGAAAGFAGAWVLVRASATDDTDARRSTRPAPT